ncbi:MAG: hypothetical protein JST92_24640 [Deltaproteobacteria bacterium]|nr:hypothetical protein [Deltaproteobacteria bacterium]
MKTQSPLLVAALALALTGACALRAARIAGTGSPCASDQQCGSGEVCFLGQCRGQAAALTNVLAQVRPSGDSPYGVTQRQGIDLTVSVVNDFRLSEQLAVSGTVTQDADADAGSIVSAPVAGATVSFEPVDPLIPDHTLGVSATAGKDGAFTVRLPSTSWTVQAIPPAPLPPVTFPFPLSQSNGQLSLSLPANAALVKVPVALTAGGAPLSYARVIAVDDAGEALSAPFVLSAAGTGQVVLPPNPAPFSLRVTAAESSTSTPGPTYSGIGPFASANPIQRDLPALGANAVLTGLVLSGASRPVPGARVYALTTGEPGGANVWSVSRSTTAGMDGSFSLALREGQYVVQAAPDTGGDSPAISSEVTVTVTTAMKDGIGLFCPNKISAVGHLYRPDGTPASNVQINATRLPGKLVTGRLGQARPSNSDGSYILVGDSGSYQLELIPTQESGLPHKIVTVELNDDGVTLPDITLSAPLKAVGTITGQRGGITEPVAGATVEFYGLDAAGQKSLLLGAGLTDSLGRYQVVLPDVGPNDL